MLAAGLDDCEHDSYTIHTNETGRSASGRNRLAARGRKYIEASYGVNLFIAPQAPGAPSGRWATAPSYPCSVTSAVGSAAPRSRRGPLYRRKTVLFQTRKNGVAPKKPFGYVPAPDWSRRGDRVVDCDGLENRCTREGTVSSNLTLSASQKEEPPRGALFFDLGCEGGAETSR